MKVKLFLLLPLAFCFSFSSYAQGIHVTITTKTVEGNNTYDLPNDDIKDIPISKEVNDLKTFFLICKDLPAHHSLKIITSTVTKDYKTIGVEEKIEFSESLFNRDITIQHIDSSGKVVTDDNIMFRFIKKIDDSKVPQSAEIPIQQSINKYLDDNYGNYISKPFGYIDPTDKDRLIHIFFDQFGNSLMSTIPQGISNAQYIVHIIYLFSTANPNEISYSVNQKSGSFSSALLFNNSNIRSQIPGQLQSGEIYDGITERKFLLGTATDDLNFEIVASSKEGASNKTVLATYTIKMSPVFHGSFDVGLLRTNLANPNFTLVQQPGSTNQVVKKTDDGSRGVVTIMATFYVSPIILLESVFSKKKKMPYYKLTGRNFLDDHKFYERIYPAVGVSISDKAFENIFFGFNWEIARGLCVFGGWHYGRVNTFDMPNFEPNITPVTNDEFELYKNKKWKTSTAFGIKLDLMIIRNLFGTAAAQ